MLANGTEETEFVATYDVLVRAGIDVKSVGVGLEKDHAVCTRNVRIIPDIPSLSTLKTTPEILVLPGGAPGAATFCKTPEVLSLIQKTKEAGGVVGAICAGTTALVEAASQASPPWKVRVTSHPSVKSQIVEKGWSYAPDSERVVVDGKLITSRGPGSAILFALAIVETVLGKAKREEVQGPMMCSELP